LIYVSKSEVVAQEIKIMHFENYWHYCKIHTHRWWIL